MTFKLNEEIFKELINRQLKNINPDKKLQYTDIKRLCKYISSSIFDDNKCCLWNGYVTNINNISKGTYINFYFMKKKVALHRLLYSNFIGELSSGEYIKYVCQNKGRCCNINHIRKFKYNKIIKSKCSNKKDNKKDKNIKILYNKKKNNLFELIFD